MMLMVGFDLMLSQVFYSPQKIIQEPRVFRYVMLKNNFLTFCQFLLVILLALYYPFTNLRFNMSIMIDSLKIFGLVLQRRG